MRNICVVYRLYGTLLTKSSFKTLLGWPGLDRREAPVLSFPGFRKAPTPATQVKFSFATTSKMQSTFHTDQWKLSPAFCNLKLVIIEMFSTQSNSRAEIFDTRLLKEPR